MAGSITSLGIGSGIDLESLVQNILAAESRPIQLLQTRQAEIDFKISGLGQVKSSVSAFQEAVSALSTSSSFRSVTANSSDDSVFTASAELSAVGGGNQIEVISLAQTNKLASQSFAGGSAIAIGTGDITIQVGAEAFTVAIGAEENTLDDIRNAINSATNNTGVTASIINVSDGSKLILTANESGTENALTVSVTDDDANNADNAGLSQVVFGLSEVIAAQDAALKVDGFDVVSSSNQVSGVIQGVTLNLTGAGTAQLGLVEDVSVSKKAIEKIVSEYNTLSASLKAQKESSLSGENILLSIESRIRNTFSSKFGDTDSTFNYAFQLGLSFDRDGVLTLDQEKFDAAIAEDFASVDQFFTEADSGFIAQLNNGLDLFLESDGALNVRTEGLNETRKGFDDDIAAFELRLESTEARIRAQFASLDALVAQLNSTSSFLTNQLSNLPLSNNR